MSDVMPAAPNVRISGDNFKAGPDGHIRHPKDKDLVWWEDSQGNRYWVRQNRWDIRFDIKTERSHPEIYVGVDERQKREMCKQWRADGVRYKVRRRPRTDWNTDEGPWEPSDE